MLTQFESMFFPSIVDYPGVTGTLIPHGDLWCYVSHTFVNGFLNYSTPRKAFLLHRYQESFRTNQESLDEFHSKEKCMHTNLSSLGDDILLLSQSDYCETEWWYFWLDHDVSDCAIGRFYSGTQSKRLEKLFQFHANEVQKRLKYVSHDQLPLEIDVRRISKWMRF